MRRSLRPGLFSGPSSARPGRPGNLPAELNRFIGRESELDALTRQLDEARLVTVTGVGGVGKTRFATHAAARVQDRFCDGVWLVELSAVHDPALVDHTVAEALGLSDATDRAPRAALAGHLADRRPLLVLDGCEQFVEECAALARELLRRAPGLRILAVGRRPLGVSGERRFPLGPMPEPAAIALFEDRAAAVVPGFATRPGSTDRATVAELCRRLDGIPLALELAAGRLGALSVEQVLHRLDDRFELLTGGARGELPRHQALRTAIGWSHELCTPRERLLWARLTVFAAHFDLEAAEYICSGPDLPEREVLDVLTGLVAQSVLSREEHPTGVRYRLLDTVRMYGAGWLDSLGDTERMRRRHRDWYMGLATWCELEWFSPRQTEVAARVDVELPNLRAALECGLTQEDAHLGQYLAGTLWFFWVGCGRLTEGRLWLDRALELDTGHDEARLKALWVAGYVSLLQGDTVAALGALQECGDEAARTGSEPAGAYALHRMGCLALVSDDMARAEELLRAALARYREIGELNSNVLMGQVELAMAIAFQGDVAGAVDLCQEVREICEDHGERWTLAYALYVLGFAAWTRGEPARARAFLEECLIIDHAFNDLVGTVLAVELLALLTAEGGDPAEAAVLQGAAGRIWRSVGLPLFGSRFFNAPHALCEEAVRGRLGADRYARLVREGAAMEPDAAVARALRGCRRRRPAPVPGARGAVESVPAPTQQPAASPSASGGETAG
ncbi:AAA family ATPase [Streptomyces varsoviensis]|uniref:ATP-binding protein n=1 Tax=Streptomyces varsoviensis TaxID=67373 RepID=UPI00340AC877